MADQPAEIDYLTAKSILERELSKHPAIQAGNVSLPPLLMDKGETRWEVPIPSLDKSGILDGLGIIKHHTTNLRVHSMDSGYLCLQSLNDNLFDTKNLTQNAKFRFFYRSHGGRLEVSKQGNLKESEILAILELFQFFFRSEGGQSIQPKDILRRLGIEVFDPIEAELKNRSIHFDQIYGYETVKKEILETIVMPMQNPETFAKISAFTRRSPTNNRPRAILFEGEPGVGKTTMAKAVSCLCQVPLVYVPIESIMSKYYGESAQNLALIFDSAALFPEALVFLDEIDSLAGRREDGMFEATKTMLSVLLRKLDGFEGKPRTITLGATNRKVDLDSALVSRFDKSIYFPLPNQEEISAILSGFAQQLASTERYEIAGYLRGWSGRKIKDFCDSIERKWATEIIQSQREPSPPPYSLYLQMAKSIPQTQNLG